MSDENTNEPTAAEGNPVADAPDTAEKLKAELDKWKSLSRKNEDRARENAEAAKAWAEHQEASKSDEEKRVAELEQLKARAAELEASLAAKDREVLVERVAASKGVPARYLAGNSEEELVQSAEQFLEDAKTIGKPVGYVGSQGTGEPTPPASSLEDVRERAKRFAGKK